MRSIGAALLLLLALEAGAQSVSTVMFDPSVVRPDRKTPVTLTVTTTAPVGSVRLDLSASESINLTADSSGSWTAQVPLEKVLKDYDPTDVGRRFVGFVRLFSTSSRLLGSFNAFIGVLDDTMPRIALGSIDANARISPRILNVKMTTDLAVRSREAIGVKLYRYLNDDYDFINVATALPSFASNRVHYVLRNNVQGIGLPLIDNGIAYGSFNRLIGMNLFPLDSYFDLGEKAASHELGHQWVNYLQLQQTLPGPHWPYSTMARHLMGFNIPGSNVGGDWPWRIEADANGVFRYFPDTARDDFSDLDLYLMGMIPPSQVPPQYVVTRDEQVCSGCPASVARLTVDDVIAASGPRVPSSAAAPKSFRLATIVITRDRLLTDDELTFFDYFAARGEATTMLRSNSGLAGKTTVRPFYLATRGIGRLDLRLTVPDPIVFVDSVSPQRLPPSGGIVTVRGSGFSTLTKVTVGGQTIGDVTIVDSHTLRFTAPGTLPGGGELIVTTTGKGSVRVPDAISWGARRRAVGR